MVPDSRPRVSRPRLRTAITWLAALALVPVLGAEGGETVGRFLAVLAVMLVAGKVAGELFDRLRQPAVLGELIAGVLLGGSVLGVIPMSPDDPLSEAFRVFAELGAVVLLFEIGLNSDPREMFRVGRAAGTVAVVGVAVPFALGVIYWLSPFHTAEVSTADPLSTALFVGAALTATSVGITARVLTDLGRIHTLEARLVIGAAVADDVIGLVILAVVSGLAAGATLSFLSVATTFGIAVGFLLVAIFLGFKVAPALFEIVDRMRVRGTLLVAAFAFALLFASLAQVVGLAPIVGAFAAGIVLSNINQFDSIDKSIKPVADIFTPIFFLHIGAAVDLSLLNPLNLDNAPALLIGLVLLVIAVIGKLVAGWSVWWQKFNRPAVGIGMIPRGEVGLIFASIGRTSGVLAPDLFNAIILMVIGTTFIAPPLLTWAFGRWGATGPDDEGPVRGAPSTAAVDA